MKRIIALSFMLLLSTSSFLNGYQLAQISDAQIKHIKSEICAEVRRGKIVSTLAKVALVGGGVALGGKIVYDIFFKKAAPVAVLEAAQPLAPVKHANRPATRQDFQNLLQNQERIHQELTGLRQGIAQQGGFLRHIALTILTALSVSGVSILGYKFMTHALAPNSKFESLVGFIENKTMLKQIREDLSGSMTMSINPQDFEGNSIHANGYLSLLGDDRVDQQHIMAAIAHSWDLLTQEITKIISYMQYRRDQMVVCNQLTTSGKEADRIQKHLHTFTNDFNTKLSAALNDPQQFDQIAQQITLFFNDLDTELSHFALIEKK